jgi:predicted amidohydrolase YtcJ
MSRADLVMVNGDIVTMDETQPRAQALAVCDGHIVALGTTAELRAYRGADTEVIDLAGRLAMPGLIDGHCHASKGAIANLFSCKFDFNATPEDIRRALLSSAARFPDAEVILGGRWGSGFFERHSIVSPRAWLDGIVPERAVYLRDDSGHNACANSRALALVGIDRHSIEPPGGRILRGPDKREPNGLLLEEADSQARGRLPDWSAAQYQTGVREMVRIANAYGITGINDADASLALLQAYQAVDAGQELNVYVAASMTTPYGHRSVPLDYELLESWRDTYGSRHVDTRFVKIYQDGVPTSARSACMLAPYIEHPDFPAGHRGVLHVDGAILAHDIAELEARGFTVKLHTAGDGSIRVALDAIETAHARSGRRDLCHELSHAGFVDAADIERFAALNVAADLSPYLWYPAPIIDSIRAALGARAEHYWPIRDLLEAGAPLLAGSDWPAAVASMNPWPGIATLVTRRDPHDATRGALWPEQAISLAQALRIFTVDGARALRRSEVTGSLAIGKSADLIVLDRNLFAIDPDAVAGTEVEMTLFEGRVVYQRARPESTQSLAI